MKQVGNRHLTDLWAVLVQGHGRIIAPDFCVAHREANSGLSTLNRTKSILSIYHQQRQLQKQRGMCLNDTYPFCQQPLSGNCHSICFSKPVLWTATPPGCFFLSGVDDGTRTRNAWNHNPVLYQLNYIHHIGSLSCYHSTSWIYKCQEVLEKFYLSDFLAKRLEYSSCMW